MDILIVEDNASDLELALHAFKKHKLANSIEIARDGEEALRVLDEALQGGRMPHLILLDLQLPKVDGLEVLKEWKSGHRTRRIPIVVLTSSTEERDIIESYDLGVNSYILKPVDFEQFTEAVRQLGLYWLVTNQPPEV